jgi:hypothetical protein
MRYLHASAILLAIGCGGGGNTDSGTPADGQAQAVQASAGGAAQVETAQWPADPCAWITVAEVEAVIGPLTGPPRRFEQGGCLYPIPMNEETAKRREAARKLGEIAKEWAKREGSTIDTSMNRPPPDPAFVVQVSVDVHNVGERALRAVENIAALMLETDSVGDSRAANAEWDYSQSPIAFGLAGFMGRVGELTVTVLPQGTTFTQESIEALAAAVRDKVPDRPFASEQPYTGGTPTGRDPCSLVTAAEAQAVLGPLTAPPYRTRENNTNPYPAGETCAYRTARHRVLRIRPIWSEGQFELKLVRGVGGLMGAILPGNAPEAADTIEGPWEEAAWDNSTGDLLFRVGDRALQVSFGTSSTDARGALKLVPTALERLKSAK